MNSLNRFLYCGIPVELQTVGLAEVKRGLKGAFKRAADLAKAGSAVHLLFVSGEVNHRVYNAVARQLDKAVKGGVVIEIIVGPLISCDAAKGNAILKAAMHHPDQVFLYLSQMRQKLHFRVLVENQSPIEIVAELPHPPNAEQRASFRLDLQGRPDIAAFVLGSIEAEKMFCQRLTPQRHRRSPPWTTNEQIDFIVQWWKRQGRHSDTLTHKEMAQALRDPRAPKVQWQWSLPA